MGQKCVHGLRIGFLEGGFIMQMQLIPVNHGCEIDERVPLHRPALLLLLRKTEAEARETKE
jgi:hypothetical protein